MKIGRGLHPLIGVRLGTIDGVVLGEYNNTIEGSPATET